VPSRNRIKWEWRRIKHSFSKREREELLNRFERDNNNLAAYVQTYEIQAPDSSDRTQEIVKYFDLVRTHACDLHGILTYSWDCTCKTGHRAYLRLEHSSAAFIFPTFNVTFPCPQRSRAGGERALSQDTSFWKQTLVNIESLQSDQKQPENTPMSATSPLSPDTVTASLSQSNKVPRNLTTILNVKEKGARKVQFTVTEVGVHLSE
jgi:hypothetical protein